jgi:predicted permease
MNPPHSSRLLRWLLRLYPRAHRERYGDEIRACLRSDWKRAGGGMGFWAGALWDHVRAAAAVRRRNHRGSEGAMRTLLDDLRHAARSLRRAPTFTAFATLTLALGIGATTAAFSVVDGVTLRPLPYPEAERMYVVGPTRPLDKRAGAVSTPLMLGLQRSPGPAEEIVGLHRGYSVLSGLGDPQRAYPMEVTEGFFSFFGATAARGRLFGREDHLATAERVVVVSHAFWRSRLGGDESALGRTLDLDDVPHEIVGVLEADFVPPEALMGLDGDLWVPLDLAGRVAADSTNEAMVYTTWAIVRLRPGASAAELEAHASRVIRNVYGTSSTRPLRSLDEGSGDIVGASAQSLYQITVGEVGSVLWRVFAAVSLLLAIACVNAASLLLTRAAERAQELTVRAALGAGRRRLVRHLLAEAVLLGAAGSTLGTLLAWLSVTTLRKIEPGGLPRLGELELDGRALAFSVAMGFAAVLLSGLVPALRAAARSLRSAGRQSTADRGEGRLRATLVGAETGLAVLLVLAAGLLAHDLARRVLDDPGYRPEGLLSASITLPYDRYEDEAADAFWRELVDGIRALPIVTSVSLASQLPMGRDRMRASIRPEGHAESEMISMVEMESSLGETLGLRVVEGRGFRDEDRDGAPVALVNEAFVETYWPGEAWVAGRTVQIFRRDHRVVGVVADTRVEPGVGPRPRVMRPLGSGIGMDGVEVLVRTTGDPMEAIPEVRALVRRLDPALVDVDLRTIASLNAAALARPRFYAILFSSFAGVALLLAVVGAYGTTAHAARARTREIGIRIALGAPRSRVVVEVLARTLLPVAAGVAVGVAGALAGSKVLTDALLMIEPRDAPTYGAVAALVLMAGGLAALVPAARASRVDPASTLRFDA